MTVLVTGGGGFLGGHVVRLLLARGDKLRCFQRGDYPELTAAGAECIAGDLASADDVSRAVAGCEAVIHTAAKAGVWGRYSDYEKPNLYGTRNVIAACLAHGVRKLVYTSTPSVVFDGHDENGIDESAPYTSRPMNHYQATKAAAEQRVLAANSAELSTVALRPHLIWGPGDPHLVPRVLDRCRSGRLRLVSGPPKLVDATYIDNAAQAHLDALDHLAPDAACAGKAYFIGNDEPIAMNELLARIIRAGGLEMPSREIGPRLAYALGMSFECVFRLLGLRREPPLTRFVARQLSCSHWFNLTAARRDLSYAPSISLNTGMERLAASLNGGLRP